MRFPLKTLRKNVIDPPSPIGHEGNMQIVRYVYSQLASQTPPPYPPSIRGTPPNDAQFAHFYSQLVSQTPPPTPPLHTGDPLFAHGHLAYVFHVLCPHLQKWL